MKEDTELRLYEVGGLLPGYSSLASELLRDHQPALCQLLARMGFADIRQHARPMGVPEPGAPQLLATRDGRMASIYLADAVDSLVSVDVMPSSAFDYADANLLTEDVYYGCLIIDCSEGDEKARLRLLGLVLMRREGRWRDEVAMVHQFLPYDKRAHEDMLSPMVGAAAFLKMDLYGDFIRARGSCLESYISGLSAAGEMPESKTQAYGILPSPMLTVVGQQQEDGTFEVERMLFMSDADPVSELELTGLPSEDEPALLHLMDETGRQFCAESLEALQLRSRLRCGQRFLWTLSLVAEKCEYNTNEFSITKGPFFEMEKRRYEEEHGEPAPENYAVRISTAEMRLLESGAESAHAVAMGVVESVESVNIAVNEMLCIRIHCLPDNDGVRLNVFAAPHVLGDYHPQPGDNIRCTGYLYASPDTLVEGDAWMDSAEVGSRQEERELVERASCEYEACAKRSLALAAVRAALVGLGWELVDDFWPYSPVFRARHQSGETALFAVNSVINGVEPDDPQTVEGLGEFMRHPEAPGGRYVICVALDYIESAQRYAVRLLNDGGFTETLRLPLYVGRAFAPTILCLDNGVASERRQYPERLDEAAMAERFARCVMEMNWEELSHWLLEEMRYSSDTVGTEFSNKHEFLSYMSRRCLGWKAQGMWAHMSMVAGTVCCGGRLRPCAAFMYNSRITALTIFEDGDGLVRAMHNLNPEIYPDFVAAEDVAPPSPRTPEREEQGAPGEEPDKVALEEAEKMLRDARTACRHLSRLMSENGGMAEEGKPGFRWVKQCFGAPGFADIVFCYQGNEYAVLTARTEAGTHPGKLRFGLQRRLRDRLLNAAREHDLIPCLYLLTPDGRPMTTGWNLRHLETLLPFSPMEQPARPDALLSDWDLHLNAIKVGIQTLKAQGYRIFSAQDVIGLNPQIWFEDEQGNRCWMLVRADDGDPEPVELASWPPDTIAQMASSRGYILRCRFRADDMGVPRRERGFFVRADELQEITPEDWERGSV